MPLLRDGIQAALGAQASNTVTESPSSFLGANWGLEGCCNTTQIVLLSLVGGYSLIIWFLWRWKVLLPFKMIVVFLHELSHALAALCTCGKVVAMEVHADEGGVTKTVGGNMWCILPAGYLGSSFWGMVFIIGSVNDISVQVLAGLLGLALFVVLFLADNNSLRLLSIFFMLLIAGFWALQLLTPFLGLQYLLLFLGVMSSLFSIYDIYDDLISRRENGSDAVEFAKLCKGTSSRCWGVIWALISVTLMALGVYLALVVASS